MRFWDGYGRAGPVVAVLDTTDMLQRSSNLTFYRNDEITNEAVLAPVGASYGDGVDRKEFEVHRFALPNEHLEALANLFGARDNTLTNRVKELEADRDHLRGIIDALVRKIAP